MRHPVPARKGNVAVFTAVCLTVLVGAAAFALDGGRLLHSRRAVQAAADAAALAASDGLFLNYQTYAGLDGDGTAKAAALARAAANGFNNDGTTNQVTVNIPPASGLHAGQANLVLAPGIYYMQGGGFSFTGQRPARRPGRLRRGHHYLLPGTGLQRHLG